MAQHRPKASITHRSRNISFWELLAQAPQRAAGEQEEVDRAWFLKILLPCALLSIAISSFLRWYWPELHRIFLTYPSDVWYIYNNYGWFLHNQSFFEIEYPVALFSLFKVLSELAGCFPQTVQHDNGGLIYSFHTWLSVNIAVLGSLGLLSVYWLHRLNVEFFHLKLQRILTAFVLTPTFIYFMIFNYDIVPIACCIGSVLYYLRRDYFACCTLCGLGFAFKIFPGLLLLFFFLGIPKNERKECILWSTAPWLLCNVPFMIKSFDTWLFPYIWQMGFDSEEQTGRLMFHLSQLLGKPGALCLMALCILTLIYFIWRRAPKDAAINPQWIGLGSLVLILLFIFTKSIFSPQYVFWLLPFLTLVTPFPFAGLGSAMELVNISECFFLDYWRGQNITGLQCIRLVRELGLLYLLCWSSRQLLAWPISLPGNTKNIDNKSKND